MTPPPYSCSFPSDTQRRTRRTSPLFSVLSALHDSVHHSCSSVLVLLLLLLQVTSASHSNPCLPSSAVVIRSHTQSTETTTVSLTLQGKNRKLSGARSRNTRDSCHAELSHQELRATHFSGSSNSYERYEAPPTPM